MGFFHQAFIGIRKELAVYKNNPMILVYKAASVVIFSALTLALTPSSDNFQSTIVTNAIFQLQLYITPARMILHKIASEREDNFKEYLMVNGMSKSAYQAKIAVTNYIEMFFFAIAESVSIFLAYRSHLANDHLALLKLFLILFFGGVATVNLALLITTKLSPQNAPTVGSALILLLGLTYFAAISAQSFSTYILVSLHPCAALALAISALLPIADTGYVWDGYSSMLGVGILAATAAIYLGLYLHAERDKDVDLKTNKKTRIESNLATPLMSNANETETVDLESPIRKDSSSAIHHEIIQNFFNGENLPKKTIEASNLKKVYPECTAVDGLSFSVYEKEIFCLLGHNGAGKSTLVNMLTGLIPMTEGTFFYNGEEIRGDLKKIRGAIGFCPQKDFLLMENSIYQNLSFFAEIKNIPTQEFEREIERVMSKLGLTPFKDVAAKKLSGGFKRKLNVAIALLNDPKIIIMDEPTSGMDPVSRRTFWDIIKTLKQEKKTVVLTTQFLDEAEELSDRLAIMSKGKLFAVGSSDFIKKKFGTGYNLILHDNSNSTEIHNRALEITDKIHSFIPLAARDYNVAPNIIQFTLPFSEQLKFADLFEELETLEDLSINLQMISLEEAFVNLGLNPEKMMEEELNESQTKEQENGEMSPSLFSKNIPQSFLREKSPTFKQQLNAILFERSLKCKTFRYLFFISYPLIFIAGGVAIGIQFDDRQSGFQMMVTMFLTGNAFLMNSFVVPLVGERVNKIIHIFKASGLRTLPYWIGNLIVDLIVKTLMCILVIITIYIFNVDYLKDNIINFTLLYLSFTFNMLALAYNLSMTFDNLTITLASGPSIMLGGTLIPNLLYKVVEILFGINIKKICWILSFIFCGPATLLQLGLNSLVPSDLADEDYNQHAPMKQTWCYVLCLLVLGIIFFIRLVIKDSQVFELKQKKIFEENEPEELDYIEQDDITNEKSRINSPENQDLIKAFEVQKVYPNGYKALHDLSFGVEKGQIFCLLGPNGAGKTTAFEIITATIPKTTGLIQLDGQNLVKEIPQVFYETGICSQSNTLWDYLTVEQHLRTAAKIKGMTEQETQEAIDYLLRVLKLEEYRHRGTEKLSGGNKRKLCVAMSMIGAPKLLFLDEPSTGMDPVARRYLWDLIRQVMKQKQGAMVLTTHYMQEAELVGDKLGILINGRFATIGSLNELKRKFGEYSIVIYEEEGSQMFKSELDELVKSVIPEAEKHASLENKGITYKVNSNSMKFAKIFYQLERAKLDGKIKDFSIYTTTLEQIFIKLAKHQRRLTES